MFQNSGPLRQALDSNFLQSLGTTGADVTDDRVAYGLSSMLCRIILIITSAQNGASSKLYQPFNPKGLKSPIALGHVKDHHFVPLKKKG